ncbi:hypothetical protein F4806DRAFT_126144 [Annulohypoxylon nitens]|nr:hypothetical protein F4806DRAFT_126144 [Annulohypoxylon nitens]
MHLLPPEQIYDNEFSHSRSVSVDNTMNLHYHEAPSDMETDAQQSDSTLYPYQNQSHSDGGISLDTRRLQIQHNTEGYRDGIIAGKAESIQTGFDEGFTLGANVGIQAGLMLGLVEGVAVSLREAGRYSSARIEKLLLDAEKDLTEASIFSEQYWATDGGWKYLVRGSTNGGDISSEDVAKAHPIIMKWEAIVSEEVLRWRIDQDMHIFGSDASQVEDGSSALSHDVVRASVDW